LNVIAGRSLSREVPDDSLSVLLTETAVPYLGLDEPLGKNLVWPGESTYRMVGVVDDFQVASLHEPIQPSP
jgi:putative ABC transport system permease protein